CSIFFFSSRRRHTRFSRDWSSDVCSSDLPQAWVYGMLFESDLSHSDPDTDALSGIAITASSGSGTWQYSTDGMTWISLGTVSNSAALLLSSDTYLRYTAGTVAETATLTFRAWDQTSGTASTSTTRIKMDATSNGGTTA